MALGTIRWDDGKFFFQHLSDDREEPTTRPRGWLSEGLEKRILSALRRKGYKPEYLQLFRQAGYAIYVSPVKEPYENKDWKFVSGGTVKELLLSIQRLRQL